jgi:hypothetical protein
MAAGALSTTIIVAYSTALTGGLSQFARYSMVC